MHSDLARLKPVLAPTAAVGGVVALIALLLFVGHRPTTTAQGPLAGHAVRHHAGRAPAAGRPGPAPPTASPVALPTAKPGSRPAHRRPAPGPPAVRPSARAAVTVLNNSRIQGLAASTAAQLRSRGWPVARVGNMTGRLPQTTLFYSSGRRHAARVLARQFNGIASVTRRPADLPGGGLTLVVTRYWESWASSAS